jgi:hypothetical protein
MKRGIFGLMALCVVFSLVLAGCPDPSNKLPVETKRYETGSDGFYQLYTNDTKNYSTFFPSFFSTSATTWEIQCKKISGASGTRFGMFIASANNSNNLYRIAIDTQGRYSVDKRITDNSVTPSTTTWTDIKTWTSSGALHTGYNKVNTIKVTKAGSTYTIYFNDTEAGTFTDYSISTITHFGFIASVGTATTESFPNTPVDVRFKRVL